MIQVPGGAILAGLANSGGFSEQIEGVGGKCLYLQGSIASRSFAEMKVEAVGEIPKRKAASGAGAVDTSGASLAIKTFLGAIEGDDSLFVVAQPLTGPSPEESPSGRVFSEDIVVEFRQAELKSQRNLHFILIEKLIELLKEAGSKETLQATLCLTSSSTLKSGSGQREKPNPKELELWIRLAAKGETAEQAVLRWGLGLSHIQQALLFTSRHLRMQMGQTSGA